MDDYSLILIEGVFKWIVDHKYFLIPLVICLSKAINDYYKGREKQKGMPKAKEEKPVTKKEEETEVEVTLVECEYEPKPIPEGCLSWGTTLRGGRYRIVDFISRGGFGITYKAQDTRSLQTLAIKEHYMPDFCSRGDDRTTVQVSVEYNREKFDQLKRKFIKEADRLKQFHHRHIVRVHDCFEENGTAYYVMDYISGHSLADVIRQQRAVPEHRALVWFNQVADALDTVHRQKIYHLDIKPANIMITQADEAILIDFGASKQFEDSEGHSVLTSSALAKTTRYAPPEQNNGNLKSLGPWSDIYALGATLLETLTGNRPPYNDEIDDVLPNAVRPLSTQMRTAITRMMAFKPGKRPQSVAEVLPLIAIPKPQKKPGSGSANKHEWVDLGLSVKWATCNVGASSPSDYGDYYAWGETTTKSSYTEDNSKTYGNNSYNRNIGGNASTDAARANWGGTWRLPTEAEFLELLDDCTWTWITQGGHNGYEVTSKKNGNSIFLPAAGWRYGSSLYDAGEYGYYWSSSPDGSDSDSARSLGFDSSCHYTVRGNRYYGRSVRPVSD